MNEFNPFETLGIDPNESLPSRTPLETETQVNPMETMWQFNPFKELNINVNWFEQPTADWKNTEVQSMLWIKDFEPMTDEEKQSYVDALSDEDWNTWNQLKSEWYSFEARKALMENQDMLYDITEPWTWKYLQTKSKEPITSTWAQRYLDWYQQRAYWMWDRFEDWMDSWINYKKNGEERTGTWSWVLRAIGNTASSILGYGAQFIEDMLWLQAHAVELNNNLRYLQWKTDQRAELDRSDESYESFEKSITSMVKDLTWLWVSIERAIPSAIFQALGSWDGPVAKVINFTWEVWTDLMSLVPNLTVNTVHNTLMTNPKVREYLEDPANEWMKEDMIEILTNVEMWILGKWLKNKKSKVWESKASMIYNDVKSKVTRDLWTFSQRVKAWVKSWNEAAAWMKEWNKSEGIEWTSMGRSNVRKATIKWFKEWWNSIPDEVIPWEEAWLPDTRITPYEWENWLSTEVSKTTTNPNIKVWTTEPTENKQTTIKNKGTEDLAKETKLSETNIQNLQTNTDLQTAFKETIKPYLEENWKNNPEWVITEPVNSLVYDIRSWIDELRVQQANLNRSINNTKLSAMEKALIKEVEKIINKKEPKQILNGLNKLTPAQKGILKRVVPNLDSRIQTINQTLELTKDIAQKDIVSSVLWFFAKKPARNLSWYARKTVIKWIKNAYEQKGIQATNEAIDKFIDWLTEWQVSTIQKQEKWGKLSNSEKKSLSDILDSIQQEGEPVWTRQLKEWEYDQIRRDSLEDQWYTPKTRLVTVDKDGKIVRHDTSVELEMKPFTSDKPLREIFKEAWVNLTLTPERIFNIKYARDDVDWVYIWDYDLMEVPSRSVSVWILAHEFGHRVMAQLTENEKLKIMNTIKQGEYNMTDAAAEERFAEYFRNYFLYGNINGKTALEVFTTAAWQKAGQRIVNIMEKTKMDLFADLWAKSEYDMYQKTKSIDKMIDNIYKLTEKGKEIINRTPEKWSRAEATKAAAQTYWRLEEFSKTDIINEDLTEIKNATNELKNIHVNEDWYIVWDFHSHETPVYGYIEDSNLPQELKDFLKKQEIKYLEEQDKYVLERLKKLNGN